MDFGIFKPKIGRESEKYLHKDWNLYVQPSKPSRASDQHVVSTSLFIFPERVKSGPKQFEEYKERVKVYLGGILKSAEYIRTLQGISLRVYLDYSVAVARNSPDPDLKALGLYVLEAMRQLVETFEDVQVIGVRYLCTDAQSTFLPSLWRFLPLFDEDVAVMTCTDADNPFNSLYLELLKPWLVKRDTTYCFIISESYTPAWCSIWAALHKVLSGSVLCPLASLWGALRKRGRVTGPIEDPKMFGDMLDLARRDDLTFAVANASFLDGIEGRVMEEVVPDKVPRKVVKSPQAMLDLLEDHVIKHLQSLDTSPLVARFVKIVTTQEDIRHFLTIFLFSTYFSRTMPMFRNLARFSMRDKVLPVVSGMGFGIDELTLQIPLAKRLASKDVTLIKSSNTGVGLSFTSHFSFTTIRDLDPNFAILQDVLPRQDDNSYVVEAMLRSVLFLYQIKPTRDSNKEALNSFDVTKSHYYRRIYECAAKEFRIIFPNFPKFTTFLDQYFDDDEFCSACLRKFIKVEDREQFLEFTRSLGVTFAFDARLPAKFVYPSLKGFLTVKAIFFRGFFVNIPTLHLFKTVSNLKAQRTPW